VSKFKVGDRIRVISNKGNENFFSVGEVGILAARCVDGDWKASFKNEHPKRYIEESDFELEEPITETFTIAEIADYIAGWASGPFESVKAIGAATLLNALNQLEDDQDGISAVRKRKENQ
jgi:3-hydroxyacyl-CoA dehydrogenase